MKNTNISNASMLLINSMLLTDGYKLGHKTMYPDGMTKLYSNFTPRSNKHFPQATHGAVVFGIQYFVKKYLIDEFNQNFFSRPKDKVVKEYYELLTGFLGKSVADRIGTDHIAALHDLGYLPIKIKALEEGIYCPIGVPMLTITNTKPEFAWLTNYLETLISNSLWKLVNSATTADVFKRELIRHAIKTGFYNPNDTSNIDFLCHDFSMRGLSGIDDAVCVGMSHFTSFSGGETLPGIVGAEYYYGANNNANPFAGTIPATEHSIECSNATDFEGNPDDEKYFAEMLKKFPEGFISVVADGYDYWNFISKIVPKYKDQIMARNGRVVIRPDSGDPVKIICGDPEAEDPIVRMGSYEFLCKTFGGTFNSKGYFELDGHIGLIYGDAINMKRQAEIYRQLEDKGIAATNLVLGIGSFTYQCSTRDGLGLAMKATYCEINGQSKEIYKDPKTTVSTGMTKKSLRGLIKVDYDENGILKAYDRVSAKDEHTGELLTVFEDGKLVRETDLYKIRKTRAAWAAAAVKADNDIIAVA
ncbi:nicotinate phosphoribosyltransferase [uncultured Methanobrevibacter sp.]|uniref:nicotinate phosphoribosyltransferase n=1 Tax=uncultured Methanobrevibacter sp. TaxID=253161 RepID=UPI00345D9AC7